MHACTAVATTPAATAFALVPRPNLWLWGAGDGLDYILEEAMGGGSDAEGPGGSPLSGLARTVTSLNRFMKSLSN